MKWLVFTLDLAFKFYPRSINKYNPSLEMCIIVKVHCMFSIVKLHLVMFSNFGPNFTILLDLLPL